MESILQPPSDLNFRSVLGPESGSELCPEVSKKEPVYECGICSEHVLLRSELIVHANEGHDCHNVKSTNLFEGSKTSFQNPAGAEPLELEQTCESRQDAMDTKLIPNPTESASFWPKYSHMCPTCYQVFDYRIQLNSHMKVHQNSPEISEPMTRKQPKPTGPDYPQLVAAEKSKAKKIPASSTTKRKATEENSETKFYFCPNSGCSFKSRWRSSRWQHTKTCSKKIPKPDPRNSVAKQSPNDIPRKPTSSKNKTICYINSEKFYLCPNSGCNFKSRWASSRWQHTKKCFQKIPKPDPRNSVAKQSPEDIPKKPTSSKTKTICYLNSEKFYLCPNSGCSFKSRWASSRWQHTKKCSQKIPKRNPLKSATKQPPENTSKKSTSSKSKTICYQNSEKFYLCPNSSCNYKSRWPSNICKHKKICHKNCPNSELKKLVKKPGKLVVKKSGKVGKKSGKVGKKSNKPQPRKPVVKKNESEPRLVMNPEKKKLECSICGFRPTAIHNFNQHKATHLKYKPFACRYPGCKFESRWEGNLRAHIWRLGHESGRKPGRNLRQESPSNVQSLSKIQAPKISKKFKKSKELKAKFKSANRREVSAKSSRSVFLKFSSPTTEEYSDHIEESSDNIEESSDHIDDPPKPDSPHHPTLPLPSISHKSRSLTHLIKTENVIQDALDSVRHEDLEKVQPTASSSNKQPTKRLKQLFRCPMDNCNFTTRWEIGIPKHFDRSHSSPGMSTCRSNKLYEQQQVNQESSKLEGLASMGVDATNGDCNNEKENQVSNNLETSELECELKVGKILSQPELAIENNQELTPEEVQGDVKPCAEVKRDVKPPTEVKRDIKPPAEVQGEVKPCTEVKYDPKRSLAGEVKGKVRRSTRVKNEANSSTNDVKVLARRSPRVFTPLSSRQKGPLKEVIVKDISGTSDSKSRFKCPQCNYQGASRWHINRHMVTHGKDRPYPCPGCSMSFQSTAHLNIHRAKYPRCDLAQRHVESNQPQQQNAARSIKALSPPAPVKTLALQKPSVKALAQPSKNDCVFCSYLSKLSKFMQKHVGKCPGCHKAVEVANVEYGIKKEIVLKREV